ncbi:MAG: zf-HC2 domain-containing protein [Vicinamibacterales bacterium]
MRKTMPACHTIRGRLHAFLDGELPALDHAAVRMHVDACADCADVLDDYRALGRALRAGLDPAGMPTDALNALTSKVVSLTSAEARQSLRARLSLAFADMRFVFAGAGSFAATFVCALSLAGILEASSASRTDSLASLMERMAAPRGSTQNPYSIDPRLLPPSPQTGSLAMPAVLVDDVAYEVPDEQYAFSGVLTSEGRIAGIEMLQGGVIDPRAMELLRSIHDSRFEPARLKNGRPVAVSFVWVHSDVTIKPIKSL